MIKEKKIKVPGQEYKIKQNIYQQNNQNKVSLKNKSKTTNQKDENKNLMQTFNQIRTQLLLTEDTFISD